MQHPWTIEINGSYHRQELLAEAANERLAAQVTRAERQETADGRWIAPMVVAPILAALGLVSR